MLHSEITFDGVNGPVTVRIEPAGEDGTSVMITTQKDKGAVILDAAEVEHVNRLLQAYRAAQEAALKALGGE